MAVIQCEACNTKFKVPEGVIPEEGKFVRCSKCDHEWLAKVQDDEKPDNKEAKLDGEDDNSEAPKATDDTSTDQEQTNEDKSKEPEEEDQVEDSEEKKSDAPKIMRRPKPMIRPITDNAPVSSTTILTATIGVVLLGLFTIYYVFIHMRPTISRAIPATTAIYEMLGLYKNKGIKITDIKWQIEKIKNRRTKKQLYEVIFFISLTNVADKPQVLDKIRVTGFDGRKNKLGRILMSSGTDEIEPGNTHTIDGILKMSTQARYISIDMGNEKEILTRDLEKLF